MSNLDEQRYINVLVEAIQHKTSLPLTIVTEIDEKCKHSEILNYYLSECFPDQKEARLKKAIELSSLFLEPYISLVTFYSLSHRFEDIVNLAKKIYMKKTIDYQTPLRERKLFIDKQIQLCDVYAFALSGLNRFKEALVVLSSMKPYISKDHPFFPRIRHHLGVVYDRLSMPEESFQSFIDGFDPSKVVDLEFVRNMMIIKDYTLQPLPQVIKDSLPSYPKTCSFPDVVGLAKKQLIHIGYFSPDLNRNAVGLECSPLFTNYDKTKFKVFVYYNHLASDQITEYFRTKDVVWADVGKLNDQELYQLIKMDQIDVLFDLIVHGCNGRFGMMASKPAPIIINYLGYPGSSFHPSYTHRIVDRITDPPDQPFDCTETPIYLDRCFICYNPFDFVSAPIGYIQPQHKDEIRVGILNRTLKFHPFILKVWMKILETNKNIIFYIKNDVHITSNDVWEKFPKDQLRTLPFAETQTDYFAYFHLFDLCVDTYPYSGTVTTMSSLYNGVPVITYYNPSNPHVNNVSASILHHSGFNEGICKNWKEYVDAVVNFKVDHENELSLRHERRKQFFRAMNPQEYMKNLEEKILGILGYA